MIVNGKNMTMTRGDSELIKVTLNDFAVTTGDKIELTVRKSPCDSTVYIHKSALLDSDSSAIISIDPNDTEGMQFGKYVYDVQLTRASGIVRTIIRPSLFIIGEEVTYG